MSKVVNAIVILLLPIVQLVVSIRNVSIPEDGLIFAHILFRHGDRNILDSYANDPWKSKIHWKEGYGELTDIGKQQQYELGAYLRKRYFSLIANNGTYDSDNIYIESTNVTRNLLSGKYTMAGMFSMQTNYQDSNSFIESQSVQIHLIPQIFNRFYHMEQICPSYDQAYTELLKSYEFRSMLQGNRTLLEYLEVHSGENMSTIQQIKNLHQTLSLEQLKGFRLPSWANKVLYPDSEFEKLATLYYTSATYTKHLARYRAGFLLRDIFDRFSMKINRTLSPDRSLSLFSGHGNLIVNVLNALNVFQPAHIPSSICFELHKLNGSFHVEILYKQLENAEPIKLFIPKCGEQCPLSKIYKLYRDILPTEDFDTECRKTETQNLNSIKYCEKSSTTAKFEYKSILQSCNKKNEQ